MGAVHKLDNYEDSNTIELAEIEVARLVDVFHKQGLNYWEILRIFLSTCLTLQMLADTEYWMKLGSTTIKI